MTCLMLGFEELRFKRRIFKVFGVRAYTPLSTDDQQTVWRWKICLRIHNTALFKLFVERLYENKSIISKGVTVMKSGHSSRQKVSWNMYLYAYRILRANLLFQLHNFWWKINAVKDLGHCFKERALNFFLSFFRSHHARLSTNDITIRYFWI